ncbi:MAG: hypothetical protein U1E78_12235 [Gammaproteobacteria bacterium]
MINSKRCFLLLVLTCLFSSCGATEAARKGSETIRFSGYLRTDSSDLEMSKGHTGFQGMASAKEPEIPLDEIAEKAKRVRANLCGVVREGTIEFWLGATMGGGIGIVQGSSETGIKITFNCTNGN